MTERLTAERAIRTGTRESALALEQTGWVIDRLGELHPGLRFEVIGIKTQGDAILDVSLSKIGGKGLFVKEIEQALLDGRIDLAVHSMKDLPAAIPAGLVIAAVTRRVDPRDVLISPSGLGLDRLPPGARVGTSSLRRAAQLLHHRPDLDIVSLRGNIGTRLRKLDELDLDAVVLAAAGLERMGWSNLMTEVLGPEICLPAAGQGALGIEVRAGDRATTALVAALDDPETALAVRAERALLGRLGGGCQVPIGAYARFEGPAVESRRLVLDGMVAAPGGRPLLRASRAADIVVTRDEANAVADRLGREVADALLEAGAQKILDEVESHAAC